MERWEPQPTEIMKQAFVRAHQNFSGGGVCLEFGIGMGNSFIWQCLQIMHQSYAKNSRLIGFDSFKGLPKETEGVWAPERHSEGAFAYSRRTLNKNMRTCNVPVEDLRWDVVRGFFDETLSPKCQVGIIDMMKEMSLPLVFVNVDVDIHRSALQALDFITPLVTPGLVIYLDDYRDPIDDQPGAKDPSIAEWGENLAWRQWTEGNGIVAELGETNNLNQRYYIVTERR